MLITIIILLLNKSKLAVFKGNISSPNILRTGIFLSTAEK